MASIVRISDIAHIRVLDELCSGRMPCRHKLIVTLINGRTSGEVYLSSYKIAILASEIASERFEGGRFKTSHFQAFPNEEALKFFTGKTVFPTADKILTKLFKSARN